MSPKQVFLKDLKEDFISRGITAHQMLYKAGVSVMSAHKEYFKPLKTYHEQQDKCKSISEINWY